MAYDDNSGKKKNALRYNYREFLIYEYKNTMNNNDKIKKKYFEK